MFGDGLRKPRQAQAMVATIKTIFAFNPHRISMDSTVAQRPAAFDGISLLRETNG